MSMLRYLLAIILLSGIGSVAKADDFQMVVIDPTVPANLVNHLFTDNFTFIFPSTGPQAGCNASQLFGLSPKVYVGCFTGENDTGAPVTSLQILIPVFSYQGQVDQPGCSPVGQDVFTTISCGFTADNSHYFLSFSGGSIPTAGNDTCLQGICNSPSIFTIAEAGIPPVDFPPVQVTANGVNAPEPGSLLLLSTGMLSGGFLLANRRRRTMCSLGSPSTHA